MYNSCYRHIDIWGFPGLSMTIIFAFLHIFDIALVTLILQRNFDNQEQGSWQNFFRNSEGCYNLGLYGLYQITYSDLQQQSC